MQTIILNILDSEEEAVTRQLQEWQRRHAVRIEAVAPPLLPGPPLTAEQWGAELQLAEASGTVRLTKAEALALFGL